MDVTVILSETVAAAVPVGAALPVERVVTVPQDEAVLVVAAVIETVLELEAESLGFAVLVRGAVAVGSSGVAVTRAVADTEAVENREAEAVALPLPLELGASGVAETLAQGNEEAEPSPEAECVASTVRVGLVKEEAEKVPGCGLAVPQLEGVRDTEAEALTVPLRVEFTDREPEPEDVGSWELRAEAEEQREATAEAVREAAALAVLEKMLVPESTPVLLLFAEEEGDAVVTILCVPAPEAELAPVCDGDPEAVEQPETLPEALRDPDAEAHPEALLEVLGEVVARTVTEPEGVKNAEVVLDNDKAADWEGTTVSVACAEKVANAVPVAVLAADCEITALAVRRDVEVAVPPDGVNVLRAEAEVPGVAVGHGLGLPLGVEAADTEAAADEVTAALSLDLLLALAEGQCDTVPLIEGGVEAEGVAVPLTEAERCEEPVAFAEAVRAAEGEPVSL